MRKTILVSFLLFFISCRVASVSQTKSDLPPQPVADSTENKIAWLDWSDATFEKAKKENRLVILDLEAVWCHWCHVMEKETYSDPKIIELIQNHFIPIRVDQDSRPDLAVRYQDYGWPATVIFNSSGQEIAKERGFIAKDSMNDWLADAIKNPVVRKEGQKITKVESGSLDANLRFTLQKIYESGFDQKNAGWGNFHRFLNPECIEYAMQNFSSKPKYQDMGERTLIALEKLVDPVWGGIYQYSTDGDWDHPHFEKIMFYQTEGIKTFIEAYALWKNPRYKKSADQIYKYVKNFLTSVDGVFYTSQDADIVQGEHSADYFKKSDAERRKLGIPRIDKNIYARENGWAIEALTIYYGVTNNEKALRHASQAAHWIIQHRGLDNGGFRHGEKDTEGLYLGDSLAMGRAFLSLYEQTADRKWLELSKDAASYIDQYFQNPIKEIGGYVTSIQKSIAYQNEPDRDENVSLARFTNRLFHYTGNEKFKTIAKQAMQYLVIPEIAKIPLNVNVLLADDELSKDPLHLTVVGSKDSNEAKKLFQAALNYPSLYRRIEWKDPKEGALPNPDVDYPVMDQPAGFICTSTTCSAPVFDPKEFSMRISQLTKN